MQEHFGIIKSITYTKTKKEELLAYGTMIGGERFVILPRNLEAIGETLMPGKQARYLGQWRTNKFARKEEFSVERLNY